MTPVDFQDITGFDNSAITVSYMISADNGDVFSTKLEDALNKDRKIPKFDFTDVQRNPILTVFNTPPKPGFPKIYRTETKVDLSLSQKWLNENRHNYVGKWIVLDGDKLIEASNNPKDLVAAAKNAGVKIPFVHFVEDDSRPFVGGWL